ncbi:DUF393 domain-containing protein [Streptomyces sp. NPDC049906]|uniref:thiol-disulfide oxidoreductase DCC family protein n=1 Tax=Streptomyces sp. NPDC049906 TaxID=3155656 RepID=UPI003428F25A
MTDTAPAPAPAVRALTVLYDATCPLCAFLRGWLTRQPQLVRLDFVPAGSDEARRRFPALDHASTLVDITVVADGGQVYRGAHAWVVCLWALGEYRALAHRLATPQGARLAKGAVVAASRYRRALHARRAGAVGPAPGAGGVGPGGGRDRHPGYARAGAPVVHRVGEWEYRGGIGWVRVPATAPAPGGAGLRAVPAAPTCTDDGCTTG